MTWLVSLIDDIPELKLTQERIKDMRQRNPMTDMEECIAMIELVIRDLGAKEAVNNLNADGGPPLQMRPLTPAERNEIKDFNKAESLWKVDCGKAVQLIHEMVSAAIWEKIMQDNPTYGSADEKMIRRIY